MPELVLWDVDHTLMATRGLGRELWADAFREAAGMTMREQASVTGSTERVILRETAKLHGLDSDEALFERFSATLGEVHVRRSAELRERGHALPGAAAALAALAERGLRQSVVTGNVRKAAEVKLSVFGLDSYVDLTLGAFAEDGEARAELLEAALRRAQVPASAAIFFGDTPADVSGGREAGVQVVAVATGRTTAEELRDAGASVVLAGLEDRGHVVRLAEG